MPRLLRVVNVLDKISRGWLPVKISKNNYFSIPYNSIVYINSNNELEISLQKKPILKIEINYELISPVLFSNYLSPSKFSQPIFLQLSLKSQTISYTDKLGESQNLFVVANNIDYGIYEIMFPVFNKIRNTSQYLKEQVGGSRFAETWFPIKRQGCAFEGRYIHLGTESRGCVTVIPDTENLWNNLFKSLLESNTNNEQLGTLEVL